MAKKPHVADAAISAAFDLAVERGWRSLSLAEIAERAGIALTDLVERFPHKADMLAAYTQGIDNRMLSGGFDSREAARDRLFDVLMRRFEAMAPDRRALGAILRDVGGDPVVMLCGLRRFLRSMALTLETAGLSTTGLGGLVRLQGLAAIYLPTLRAFLDDDTPDLTRTMAALDKALLRAEGVASLVWGRSVAQRPHGGEQPAERSA